MQTITSGTSGERIVRATMVAVLVNVFAVWFLWDGCVGYARANARELAGSLGLSQAAGSPIDATLTSDRGRRLAESINTGASLEVVTEELGDAALSHGQDAYYLGSGGHLRIARRGGRVAEVEWSDGTHTETDQAWQRGLGYGLGALGILLALQLVRVVTTRAQLTDAGLKVGGRPVIEFNAMTGMRAKPGRAGVELEYRANDSTRTLPLDPYIVKRTDAIVAAICERKGFTDPRGGG